MSEPSKQPYQPPKLKTWGTVRDLTAVGATHCGSDMFNGSIDAGGSAKARADIDHCK